MFVRVVNCYSLGYLHELFLRVFFIFTGYFGKCDIEIMGSDFILYVLYVSFIPAFFYKVSAHAHTWTSIYTWIQVSAGIQVRAVALLVRFSKFVPFSNLKVKLYRKTRILYF